MFERRSDETQLVTRFSAPRQPNSIYDRDRERWKNGQSAAAISRALERKNKTGVERIVVLRGGIGPAPRRRAFAALRLEEREEISRGIAVGRSIRQIAQSLGRAPFSLGSDPVRLGLVASLNRPGGNVTGISGFSTQIAGKRSDLLRALLPQAVRFAMLVNPKSQINAELLIEDGQAAALAIGRPLEVLRASTDRDIDVVFESLTKDRVDALLVSPDPLFVSRRAEIIALVARRAVPAMYPFREDALAGGLMSYGGDLPDSSVESVS
jgi:ABC transporter substrate binding protein/Helix-turn-helix domain